ncbi:unnamed protein product [Meloidogyne enterolobii]|uniref:Uncharacterized protein n=1 Tax=Meloidogyne enterolobii TaxID=390850 RepID=A0ACB1AXQ5_MELEN
MNFLHWFLIHCLILKLLQLSGTNAGCCQSQQHENESEAQVDYDGEGECEAEDDSDGDEGDFQEENPDTGGQWEEEYEGDFQEGEWEEDYECEAQVEHQYTERESDLMPSSSQGETSYHYGAYDEDIHLSQPHDEEATDWENQPSSSQTGGMPYITCDDDMTAHVQNLSENIQNIKLKGHKFYYFFHKRSF